jgi:hypothetical protein
MNSFNYLIILSRQAYQRINEGKDEKEATNVQSAKFPASNRPTGLASRKQPSAHHPGADMNIIMLIGHRCNGAPTWPVGNGEIQQLGISVCTEEKR